MPRIKRLTRVLFLFSTLAASAAYAADPQPKTLIGPELSDREKVVHVLSRLGFGPRPGEIDDVLAHGGAQAWIKQQLAPDTIDDSAVMSDITRSFAWSGKADIDQFEKACPSEDAKNRTYPDLRGELPQYVLYRAVYSKRQFQEVIVEFWRNHFCVDMPDREKSRSWTAGHYEEQVIRKYAFGKFKDMLYASATHPAMLEYLDNKLSRANAWNENYAREVMELHTVGADHGYTNNDVTELSKIFTGWQYDDKYHFIFNAREHQPGFKNWMGYRVPAGEEGGQFALTTLAQSPACAQFISEKLCRYLINDNPPPALVKRIAAVFQKTDGDLPKVYAAIIASPEFFSRENYRAKFKTPFAFTVSALRSVDARVDDFEEISKIVRSMGQPIYDCPDPTGYRFVAESWMDAGVLTSRWDFAWNMMSGLVKGVHVERSFVDAYQKMDDPEGMRIKMINDIIGADIGDREKNVEGDGARRLLSILLGSPSFQQE